VTPKEIAELVISSAKGEAVIYDSEMDEYCVLLADEYLDLLEVYEVLKFKMKEMERAMLN
jgi:hypothetical protein